MMFIAVTDDVYEQLCGVADSVPALSVLTGISPNTIYKALKRTNYDKRQSTGYRFYKLEEEE